MPRVCSSKDFFRPNSQPFQVFIKQTECKFPHCFLRAKGFPLYAVYVLPELCVCTKCICFFFLFVPVEKINLINYDGVGVFFLSLSHSLIASSRYIHIRTECITRSLRNGRLMIVLKSLEPKVSAEIYNTSG